MWPLSHPSLYPDAPGMFGAIRKHDIHTGIDLYCPMGTKVLSIEDGVVVDVVPFTGSVANPPTPFWNDTYAVVILGDSGYLLYGEIEPTVSKGDRIQKGQPIGHVVPVLRSFKGRPMVMLHMEAYSTYAEPVEWLLGHPKPNGLEDITPILRKVEPVGSLFNMTTYNGEDFRDPSAKVLPSPYYTRKASVVLVESNKRILLLRRGLTDPSYPGDWCLPGGCSEDKETEQEAAIRETYEETGILLESLEHIGYESTRGILVSVFRAELNGEVGVTLSHEHTEYKWVGREDLQGIYLPPMTHRVLR